MKLTRAYVEWMVFWIGCLCLLLMRRQITSDGTVRVQALQELVRSGSVHAMKYSLVGPLFALPLAALNSVFKLDQDLLKYFNLAVFYAGMAAFWRLFRPILDPGELRLFLILLVFGSLFPFSTTNFFGETFSAMLLGLGSTLFATSQYIPAGVLLSLGAANTPPLIVPLALLVAYHCWERRRIAALWILALTVAIILGDRWLRFDDLLRSGYEGDRGYRTFLPFSGAPGFSYPFLLGVVSILFSFGKGLVFFFPPLWLPLWRSHEGESVSSRKVARYWIILCLGMVLIYSKWWSWYGGWHWGPRLFLFCSLPASLFLAEYINSVHTRAVRAGELGLALVLLGAVFWICLSGLLYDQSRQNGLDLCYEYNYALESACWYMPEYSPIFRPLVIHQVPNGNLMILTPAWIVAFLCVATPLIWRLGRSLSAVESRDSSTA